MKHMDDPVYGYFNMKDKDGGKVYVDDQYVTLYNTWLVQELYIFLSSRILLLLMCILMVIIWKNGWKVPAFIILI